jgi:hypothetical protein
VLNLLAAGWNTAEIAETLGKSRSTVQLQSRFCLFRLGAVNIPHAVALAYGLRIVSAAPPPRRRWIPRGPKPGAKGLLPGQAAQHARAIAAHAGTSSRPRTRQSDATASAPAAPVGERRRWRTTTGAENAALLPEHVSANGNGAHSGPSGETNS